MRFGIVTLTPLTKDGRELGKVDFMLHNISFWTGRWAPGKVQARDNLVEAGSNIHTGSVSIPVKEGFEEVRMAIANAISQSFMMEYDLEQDLKKAIQKDPGASTNAGPTEVK